MGLGRSAAIPLLRGRCRMLTSMIWASRGCLSYIVLEPNQPNRRVRHRTHGGVTGTAGDRLPMSILGRSPISANLFGFYRKNAVWMRGFSDSCGIFQPVYWQKWMYSIANLNKLAPMGRSPRNRSIHRNEGLKARSMGPMSQFEENSSPFWVCSPIRDLPEMYKLQSWGFAPGWYRSGLRPSASGILDRSSS